MNQDSVCKEFCDGVRVREVRNGYAISTPYDNFLGDPLAFYALRDGETGGYRIFDDGTLLPHLEAAGATLDNATRLEALLEILKGHGAQYDDTRGELFMRVDEGGNLSRAVLDFMAVLLRVTDLLFMVQERAESTFVGAKNVFDTHERTQEKVNG